MSIKSLSDYTIYSKYSHYLPEKKRRETWDEIVDRVFGMHRRKYASQLASNKTLRSEFDFAENMFRDKRVLGSQRALQYGGDHILKKNERIYNCSSLLIDKCKSFQDSVFLLLAGCGVGFSVQRQHIEKLPKIAKRSKGVKKFVIPDSVEGWADSVGVLLSSFFVSGGTFDDYSGYSVEFDFSAIRPKGALIANQFKAPGPDPLKNGLSKIENLISARISEGFNSLRPIDAYDILMHCADFVISGGLRRSATISLFSKDDEEMTKAKTGDWYLTNPQRGRSNNSVVLNRKTTTKKEFDDIFKNIKDSGEPGFYFVDDDYASTTNPCCEIGFYPILPNGETGVAFCNLSEINGRYCTSEDNFLNACRAASILGTIQAGYSDFPYLGKTTEEIVRKEALLGVSLTGWMENPKVLFNDETLRKGAEICKSVNKDIAEMLRINPAARITCVKPSGSASCVLGTSSGIHPHHSKRYIRNVQANKQEFGVNYYKSINPLEVQNSAWSANNSDDVISFLCEVPHGSIVKNDIGAIEFLEKIKLVQQNWVIPGTIPERGLNPTITHNVSNTVVVKDDEWDDVANFIYQNRSYFSGISLLSGSGDLDYRQAPFINVLNDKELIEKYGGGILFSSGLIVDALHAFDGDLYSACETALGVCKIQDPGDEPEEPKKPIRKKYKTEKEYSSALMSYSVDLSLFFSEKANYKQLLLKHDWIRRANQFAERYFNSDVRKMTYALKHVDVWKRWVDMKRSHNEIDWSKVVEDSQQFVNADSLAAQACSGGKCDVI